MRDILGRAGDAVLEDLAGSTTLVALDFDGTLAPIVSERDEAWLPDGTRSALARLCASYPTVVISGRSRADVARRLLGLPIGELIGNHGIEPNEDQHRFAAATRELRARLSGLSHPGVEIEDKGCSLAIHYRRSRPQRDGHDAIRRAVDALPTGTRIIEGKAVVNVLPAGAPNKGDALRAHWARSGMSKAIFVGDDVTDEDVFRQRLPGLVGVRVGRSRGSAAPWFVRRQADVEVLVDRLASLRG
jgi:trehalose 6-phosphate phosphatase